MNLTPVSRVFTFCPPLPPQRKVCNSQSAAFTDNTRCLDMSPKLSVYYVASLFARYAKQVSKYSMAQAPFFPQLPHLTDLRLGKFRHTVS